MIQFANNFFLIYAAPRVPVLYIVAIHRGLYDHTSVLSI